VKAIPKENDKLPGFRVTMPENVLEPTAGSYRSDRRPQSGKPSRFVGFVYPLAQLQEQLAGSVTPVVPC